MTPPRPSPPTHALTLAQELDAFHARFVRIGAVSIGLVCVLAIVASIATRFPIPGIVGGVGIVLFGAAYALTFRGGPLLGRRAFVYGLASLPIIATFLSDAPGQIPIMMVVMILVLTLASFLLQRVDVGILLVAMFATLLVILIRELTKYDFGPEPRAYNVTAVGLLCVQVVVLFLFTANTRRHRELLLSHIADVDRTVEHADRIAKGDLTGAIEGDGALPRTVRAMLDGLRTTVARTRHAAAALSSSTQEIAAMARQQEQGAVEQASAVGQVHKTLATLLGGSSEAARSTETVFRNVEMTQRTTELVAQRAAALSSHTRRISALLEVIKGIANKSEILALNAALEGARAGEAGRGFSLVASQMQRLAESVMGSVRDVRALVEDIDTATAATLAATEESMRLSAQATAAAKEISVTLQQQRLGTEQVTTAMADIQHVTAQVSAGSSQSLSATRDLTRLAEELLRAVEGFQV